MLAKLPMASVKNKQLFTNVLLCLVALSLYMATYFPLFIEQYYSTHIYFKINAVQQALFGWLPFSIGDVLYAVVIISLVYKMVLFFIDLFNKKVNTLYLKNVAISVFKTILITYILFMIFWGLNYERLGITHQTNIDAKPYTTEQLCYTTYAIIAQLNACKQQIKAIKNVDTTGNKNNQYIAQTYLQAATKYPFLNHKISATKTSLFSAVSSYINFSGYYNPFTAEAQVTTNFPYQLLPFTQCHEVAHQLGYASESEANFVAFLVAQNSNNYVVKYAALLEMFLYCKHELMLRNTYVEKVFVER